MSTCLGYVSSPPPPPAQQDFVLPSRHSQVLSVVLNRSATYAGPPTFSDVPTPMLSGAELRIRQTKRVMIKYSIATQLYDRVKTDFLVEMVWLVTCPIMLTPRNSFYPSSPLVAVVELMSKKTATHS